MEITLTDANYNSVVDGSELPVLIDFWAEWCPPCRMLSPVVESVAVVRDDLVVCKVNADENQELCMKFGVSSIPALFLLRDGKIIDSTVGYRDKDALLDWIDAAL